MQVNTKTGIFALAHVVALGIPLAAAETESNPLHPFVGIGGGLYDTGDSYLTLIEGGISYERGPLIHSLFMGTGRVHRDDENNLDAFDLGYRLAYPLNGKLSAFAEIGAESFGGEDSTTDALGNPVILSVDSDHYFLGAGFQTALWRGLNVNFSCRYFLGLDDAAFSHTGSDALGNPILITGDTPNLLVKFGVSYCF